MTNDPKSWAVVTGAGRGIGRAIAVALAERGYGLALAARTREQLEGCATACREAGAADTAIFTADLTVGSEVDGLADAVLAHCGRVEILVNNAGMAVTGNADEGDPDEWDRLMALNVSAPMRLTRRLAPAMIERESGTIINLGSVAALEGMQGAGAYATSKFALRGWSLSCYQRLRGYGIKVVLLNPAFVDTELVSGFGGAIRERMLQPGDIAQAAMLAVTTSPACCPEEINLRLTKSAYA
jgi:short-subunit dehydrogenase